MPLESWFELALLVVVARPLAHLLGKRPVRREVRDHPRLAVGVTLVVVALLAGIAWSGMRSPVVLRISTAVVLVAAAAAHVRARPAYGARRHLPPGSLGLSDSLDAITEEDFYARAARRWGPVFKMSQFHRPVVCVTDLELGLGFIRSQAASLEQLPQPWGALIPGGYIEFMNGRSHERYREILRRPLSGAVIAASTNEVAAIIRRELSVVASDPSTDLEESLTRITSSLLVRVFFGISSDSPEADFFHRSLADIDRRVHFAWRIPPELEADVERVARAVRNLAGSDHDRLSVLGELARTNPKALDDPTVVRNLVFLVQNARPTLAGMLRWLLKLSGDHPQWTSALGQEHHAGGDALATQFVNELFRLWQSEYAYRRTLRECWIGDYRVPKGWLVRVCLREGHGRADVFHDPAVFDPSRFAARRYAKHEYAPFSDGPHACFGVALTVTVARTFLHELAAGYDARIVSDGPPERSNRHWAHWRPSTKFRVVLTARQGQKAHVLNSAFTPS